MISISRTDALIGIDTQNARLDIKASTKGRQTIRTENARATVEGKFPTIEIDSSATRREFGYRSNADLVREAAQQGMRASIDSIKRIASDGNRMMNIKNGVPPAIPELAKKNSQDPPKTINIGFAGATRPKIDVVGGQKTNWQVGELDIDYTPIPVENHYTRGKVDVYLRQKPDIDIRYIDESI